MPEALMSIRELGSLLSVSRAEIYRLIKKPGFPKPIKVGGALRWSLADVQGWLDSVRSAGADGR